MLEPANRKQTDVGHRERQPDDDAAVGVERINRIPAVTPANLTRTVARQRRDSTRAERRTDAGGASTDPQSSRGNDGLSVQ